MPAEMLLPFVSTVPDAEATDFLKETSPLIALDQFPHSTPKPMRVPVVDSGEAMEQVVYVVSPPVAEQTVFFSW